MIITIDQFYILSICTSHVIYTKSKHFNKSIYKTFIKKTTNYISKMEPIQAFVPRKFIKNDFV